MATWLGWVACRGLGKKSAERLVLELKSKVAELQGPGELAPGEVGSVLDEASRVVLALTSMGYKAAEAQTAVRSLGDSANGRNVPELIRDALARLSR